MRCTVAVEGRRVSALPAVVAPLMTMCDGDDGGDAVGDGDGDGVGVGVGDGNDDDNDYDAKITPDSA